MAVQSAPMTIDAPVLTSVWVHDPRRAEETVREFRYGSGRSLEYGTVGSGIRFAGREFPVYQFGDHADRSISFTLIIPYSERWEDDIAFLRELVASRRAWIYRDDRGRLIYGVCQAISETDAGYGTDVSVSLAEVDFYEEVQSGLRSVPSSVPQGDS